MPPPVVPPPGFFVSVTFGLRKQYAFYFMKLFGVTQYRKMRIIDFDSKRVISL